MQQNIDFHGHPILYPSYDKNFGLEKYVNASISRGITMPPITNFGDEDRFSKFYEDKLSKNWLKEKFDYGFIISCSSEKRIFLRSQEVPTKEGHLLLVGLKKNLKSERHLEETLKEAEDSNAIIIADHPLIPAIRGGLGKNNILKYQDKLHALESNSQATNLFGPLSFGIFKQKINNELIYELGKEINLPVVANSDFHMSYLKGLPYFHGNLDSFGITYNQFNLGDNPSNYLNEIKQNLKQNNFTSSFNYASGLSLLKWQIPIIISNIKDKLNPNSPSNKN